jgi:hypothetical protein
MNTAQTTRGNFSPFMTDESTRCKGHNGKRGPRQLWRSALRVRCRHEMKRWREGHSEPVKAAKPTGTPRQKFVAFS